MPLKEVGDGALDAGVLQRGTQKRASVRAQSRPALLNTQQLPVRECTDVEVPSDWGSQICLLQTDRLDSSSSRHPS